MVFNAGASIIIGIISIWLAVLTVLVVRMLVHYNRLTGGITDRGLREVLETMLRSDREAEKKLKDIDSALATLRHDGLFHIQRIGIVRFNPFSDTGGAQSFTMAVLDGDNNGVVMTSLYARAGNRWYMKEIKEGKGRDAELSKEEEAAIRKSALVKMSHV